MPVSYTHLDVYKRQAYGNAIQLVESLEFRNMLRQEADQMSCVLKINSGARCV